MIQSSWIPREESNGDRKERYHCWSLDAIEFAGAEYSTPNFAAALFDGREERHVRVWESVEKRWPDKPSAIHIEITPLEEAT